MTHGVEVVKKPEMDRIEVTTHVRGMSWMRVTENGHDVWEARRKLRFTKDERWCRPGVQQVAVESQGDQIKLGARRRGATPRCVQASFRRRLSPHALKTSR